jgi:uncharacterized repeat protein (TIGR03803 family)
MSKSQLLALASLCVATAISAPAQTFTTLTTFNSTIGFASESMSLVQGFDGNFYGTSAGNDAWVFRVTPGGNVTGIYKQSEVSQAGVVQGTDGNFYGTTQLGGANGDGTIFGITPDGTLTLEHNMGLTSGTGPRGALVQADNGKFYGTASAGGTNGRGTVFKITANGALNVLYNFCNQTNCADGAGPVAGLVQADDGNFYGTTFEGGLPMPFTNGDGTVFKITPGGALTTLYKFGSNPNDGDASSTSLIQGTDGNFYGTASGGSGGPSCSPPTCGLIFKVTPKGTPTTLHSFTGTDGAGPMTALVQATDGNLYGTTFGGGSTKVCANGCGTAFRIGPNNHLTTLHIFCPQSGCTDGLRPGGMVQGTDGNLYGTAGNTFYRIELGLAPFVKTLPVIGTVGENVIILGTNLTGASNVSFNGTSASFNAVSPTEIEATVPMGATTGSVTVTTPSSTLKSNKKFVVTSAIN